MHNKNSMTCNSWTLTPICTVTIWVYISLSCRALCNGYCRTHILYSIRLLKHPWLGKDVGKYLKVSRPTPELHRITEMFLLSNVAFISKQAVAVSQMALPISSSNQKSGIHWNKSWPTELNVSFLIGQPGVNSEACKLLVYEPRKPPGFYDSSRLLSLWASH